MFRFGYAAGFQAGRQDTKEEYERHLAILREDYSALQRKLAEAEERNVRLMDRLVSVCGVGSIIPQREPVSVGGTTPSERSLARTMLDDPWADQPFGADSRGRFKDVAEAVAVVAPVPMIKEREA